MKYRIEVAGKIFEGSDIRLLLRRAVEAKRDAARPQSNRRQPAGFFKADH